MIFFKGRPMKKNNYFFLNKLPHNLIHSTAIFCQMTLHFGNFPEPLNMSSILENCQNAKSFGKKWLWN